jgi:hypothetical protein
MESLNRCSDTERASIDSGSIRVDLSIRILQESFIEQAILKAGDVEFKKSVMLVRTLELMNRYILFMVKTSW